MEEFHVYAPYISGCNSERMLKIGVEIPKLAQKYNGYPFFGPPCMLVTSNSSHVHYFLSRRSIGPGQTDVLSLLGRLAD